MKNKVEIILMAHENHFLYSDLESNECIFDENIELLDLKEGDEFYFSLNRPYSKTEEAYRDKLKQEHYKESFINKVIDNIKVKCDKHHIHLFKVIKISRSLVKDYRISISEPTIVFTKSIFIIEL